jgi:hypothetical protein
LAVKAFAFVAVTAAIAGLAGCSNLISSTSQVSTAGILTPTAAPTRTPVKSVAAARPDKTMVHCLVNVTTPDDYRAQVIATGSDCRNVLAVVRRDIASYNAEYQMGLTASIGRVPWDSADNAICQGIIARQAGIVVNPGQDETHYYAQPVCNALGFSPAE